MDNLHSLRLALTAMLIAYLFAFTGEALAANNPSDKGQFYRTGTSPFTPPMEDVFVTNKGPGLDTGCTFNDDPNHPLIIEIMIDRAVGEVDANGLLVDPAAAIAAGIVPASVELLLPAFDVDVNGGPPPESDEVIFNGTSLGFLTGDNNIWKLNAFNIGVDTIKFPAPPATPGGTVTPVANIVQINIDTLTAGNWCTAIDWVAINLPIESKYALTIEAVGSNGVREIADNIIYKQSFDAACNITTDIGPFDEFPFSGVQGKDVSLKTTIERCPGGGEDPEVEVDWAANGPTPLQTKGKDMWTGFEDTFKVKMLDRVSEATVNMNFTIDGESVDVDRKLFVTHRTPRSTADCAGCTPKRKFYEVAVDWAGGTNGAANEPDVIVKIRQGMYTSSGWNYFDGYSPNDWLNLVEGTLNDGNCVGFSNVLQNMSAVLGANAGTETRVRPGTFVTNSKPSLDTPFFMAGPQSSTALDRHVFGMHSLVKKSGGPYHDSTFDGEYAGREDFIAWHVTSPRSVVTQGGFQWLETDEGALLRPTATPLPAPWNTDWGNELRYLVPPPLGAIAEPMASGGSSSFDSKVAKGEMNNNSMRGGVGGVVNLAATASFVLEDDNSNGYANGLAATVSFDVLQPANLLIITSLMKNGQVIANRARWNDNLPNFGIALDAIAGSSQVVVQFSGEEIFQAGEDGPYDLMVQVYSGGNLESQVTYATDAYTTGQFGELPAAILGGSDAGVDNNNDGLFDLLRASVNVQVREAGEYVLTGSLWKEEDTIVDSLPAGSVNLTSGTDTLVLDFNALAIQQFGQNGPYTIQLTLTKVDTLETVENSFDTAAYLLNDLTLTLLRPDGPFTDSGLDLNQNGLFDFLVINFGSVDVASGSYLLSASITSETTAGVVFSEEQMLSGGDDQIIGLQFNGLLIRSQEMDGPYKVIVTLSDANTNQELERLILDQVTTGYSFTDFEDEEVAPNELSLTGENSDNGNDLNGNFLFDQLIVNIGINVEIASNYTWNARLEDSNGTEIAFDNRSGFLSQGDNSIQLIFDGNAIGANGVNGPYEVKGLLVFSNVGPNLVVTEVLSTFNYLASQFEGFVGALPGDLTGDGFINTADAVLLFSAFGSCTGDANFVPLADYDMDGCITFYDYRTWYVFFANTSTRN